MFSLKSVFYLVLFFWVVQSVAQNTIEIDVSNVPSSEGKISAALYADEQSFLKFEGVLLSQSVSAQMGITHLTIKDVPEGKYAIALFYDENANDELDTNWIGIPKEKVAFSNAKMKLFGPPSFQECSFNLQEDTLISIQL